MSQAESQPVTAFILIGPNAGKSCRLGHQGRYIFVNGRMDVMVEDAPKLKNLMENFYSCKLCSSEEEIASVVAANAKVSGKAEAEKAAAQKAEAEKAVAEKAAADKAAAVKAANSK